MKQPHRAPVRRALIIFLVAGVVVTSFRCSQTEKAMQSFNNRPVSQFDLDRYLGTWYEIARFPHRFEKDLAAVTATYEKRSDGKVKVINSGYKGEPGGPFRKATGKAKVVGTGHLKVSFFLFFYADYFVMELDPDYQWALVGSSSPGYLWILSRSPEMEAPLYDSIVTMASQRGYDPGQLIRVDHFQYTGS